MTGMKQRIGRAIVTAVGIGAAGIFALPAGRLVAAPGATTPGAAAPGVTPPPAGVPVAGTPGAATAGKPSPAAVEKSRKTAEALAAQGLDTLALGDVKAARDLFLDVLQLDPKHRKALEALGYCYIKLDDMPRATRSLEGALVAPATPPATVPPAGTSAPAADPPPAPSRSLTINLAMSLLRNRNPVRGATMLRDYLAATPSKVDEDALNALAVSLDQASKEARLTKQYQAMVAFYETANAKLESTRTGERRWGIEWISKREWNDKQNQNKQIREDMATKMKFHVEPAKARAAEASAAYEEAKARARRRQRVSNLGYLESEAVKANERVNKEMAEYNEIAEKILRPTFPKMFAAVPMELPTALASAGPMVPEPAVIRPVPVAKPPKLTRTDEPPIAPPAADPTPPPEVVVAPPPPPEPPRRKAFTYAAGFAVTTDLMVTSAAAVEGTTRISVQPVGANPFDAEVVKVDAASGLALIKLKGGRLPALVLDEAFVGGPVTCAGFPTPAIFDPEAEVITGSAAAPKDKWSVRLAKHPRLPGAPVISGGKVVGVELASRESETGTLPTATPQQIKALVAGLPLPAGVGGGDPKSSVALVSGVR
jgi:hypothetical protein